MGYSYRLSGDERLIGLLIDCLVERLLREGFARSLEVDGMAGPQITQFTKGNATVTVQLERDIEGVQARLTLEAGELDPRPLLRRAGIDLLEACITRAVAPALGLPPGELMDRMAPILDQLTSQMW